MTTTMTETLTGERADLLETLTKHRGFLRHTVRGLTTEQASLRPTESALCLGGLVKHVTMAESAWLEFILAGMGVASGGPSGDVMDWPSGFQMLPEDTIESLLDAYEELARRTDDVVRTVDLDQSFPLPEAPWFESGARWSVRRVLLHIIAETAQHAGHADIIRETLDGQKTMG
jgi:hypothetical protein